MPSSPQTAQQFEAKLTHSLRAQYLLFLPRSYDPQGPKRWPLLLFLHGSGERGSALAKVKVHGPPRIVESQPDFPFVLVSPQCPSGEIWCSEILCLLLEDILGRHRVDPSRVYLTGISMGGYGVWKLAIAYPERFAAIAPICGGGDVLPILLGDRQKIQALRTLGVWAFHGGKDPVVGLEESEKLVAAFRHIGNEARLTIYPEAGHDSWTETYNNPALYRWFLEHQRRLARPIFKSAAARAGWKSKSG
jgi:predicted peptidase